MKIDGKILTIYQPNKEIIDLGSIHSLYIKDCILTDKGAVDSYIHFRDFGYKCFWVCGIIIFWYYQYIYWDKELTINFSYLKFPFLEWFFPISTIAVFCLSLFLWFIFYNLWMGFRNADRLGQAVMAKLSSNKTKVLFASKDEETFDNVFTEIEKAMKNGFHEGYEFFED